MSTHNICFYGEIRKIFTSYPLLSRPLQCRPRSDIANCVPDQFIKNAASDQGLQCLPLISSFSDTSIGNKIHLINFGQI